MKNNKYLILGCLLFWSVLINAQNEKRRWSLQAIAGIGFSKYDINKYTNTTELRPELSGIQSNFESIKVEFRIKKNLSAYMGFDNCNYGYFIDENQKYYQYSENDYYKKNQRHIDRMLVINYGFKIDFSKSFYMNLGLYNGYNYKSEDKVYTKLNSKIDRYKYYMGMNVGFGYDWFKIKNFKIGNQVNFYHSIRGVHSKYQQNTKGIFVGFCATMEL